MAFLIDIGSAIVTKLVEYTVESAIRQVSYVIYYNKNLKELQTQVDDLVDARTSLQHSVQAEERNGKTIEPGVQNWLAKVDQLTKVADDLNAERLAQTKCLICPNLKLRHRLSRKSTKLVQDVAELCEKKKSFVNIAYDAPLEEVLATTIEDYEALDSRSATVEVVINELRTSNTYMIGIYGIGGVGKTTLVKEVYRQLHTGGEKLFDEVVLVLDLKQNPSIDRIQKAIAEKLGLVLSENSTPDGRASLISNRIKDKKTLVILDDVWDSIELEAVGLPRMENLKILLTSRSKLVLSSEMGTEKEFPLEALDEKESWILFQKMAGDAVKRADIQAIATQVAKKCGGLPLLIVTVARSLKDRPLYEWKDTLRRLKQLDGKGPTEKTYSCIKGSYNNLNNEELKSLFLLCATEAGRYNGADILSLVKYSIGLGFIKDVETMEEARDAINSMLMQLQHSCLLLYTKDEKWVRIHDLVKDIGQHIAAQDHHVLSVSYGDELTQWPDKEFCEKCTRISLKYCQIPDLPEVLHCPELTQFYLASRDVDSQQIPSRFFEETKKLRVLDLTNRSMASLPPSLKCLKDLRTLCLDRSTLGDVALVGELQKLEILSFLNSEFQKLPEEIGQLTRLVLLDLTGCSKLKVISPDAISKLRRLEELRMGRNSFNNWEAGRVGDTSRSNASLEELRFLPRLTTLQVHIPDVSILPANLFTTSKLERFQICIGSVWKWDEVDEAHNALKLQLNTNNELDEGLKLLLEKTQELYLEGMEGVIDKFFDESATRCYEALKHLHVQNIAKLAYTINEKVGFRNLTWLAVSELNSVRFLLSSSMARSLSKLKRLQISRCQILKEVISIEESNIETSRIFPQLQDLELKGLPNLTNLCSTSCLELPNPLCDRLELEEYTAIGGICEQAEENDSRGGLDVMIQYFLFDNKIRFSNMKKLSIDGVTKLTTIWNNQHILASSENLETIEVNSCDSLKSVLPSSIAKNLLQLRSLKVHNCGVDEIISQDQGVQMEPIFDFPKLSYVKFQNLPKLKSFYPGRHDCKLPSLETLLVYNCSEVQVFANDMREWNDIYALNKRSLFQLKKDSYPNLKNLGMDIWENENILPLHWFTELNTLYIYAYKNSSLNSLEKLFGLVKVDEQEIHAVGDVTFPHLRELHLFGMRKLMNCGDDSFGLARLSFPKVESLKLEDCDGLPNLRFSAIFFNKLTTLRVSRCRGLKWLISFSMAKNLTQLTTLEVGDCEQMIEIVASSEEKNSGGHEMTFKVLKHLELSALPNLKAFCSGTCIVRFPSLEKLSITGCTQLEGFIFDPTNISARATSNERADPGVVQRFLFDNKVMFPNMKKLSINGVTKLTTIWNNQHVLDSSEKLETIEVHSCDNLRSVFPASMAKNLLQLKSLEVQNCGVDAIISQDQGVHDLPNITRFCSKSYVEFPSLVKLQLEKCPKLQSFILKPFSDGSSVYNELEERSTKEALERIELQCLFDKKVGLPELETLIIKDLPDLTNIWDSQLAANSFCKLKDITVQQCNSLTCIFTDSIIANVYQSIEKLTVENCGAVEEIVIQEGKTSTPNQCLFPQVSCLKLKSLPQLQTFLKQEEPTVHDLPNLTRFCPQSYVEFPTLVELQLEKCPKLQSFILNPLCNGSTVYNELGERSTKETLIIERVKLQCLFDKEVGLPELEILIIKDLPNLTNIWGSQLATDSFCKLKDVTVQQCNSLACIFTDSIMARVYQSIEKLTVENCGAVEEIVVQEGETSTPNKCLFPQVSCLELKSLPQLKTFPIRRYKWPLLKRLVWLDCPRVDTWEADFPTLKKTDDRDGLCSSEKQGVLVLIEKTSFPKLEDLTLAPINIWYGPPTPAEKAIFPATEMPENVTNLKLHGMEKLTRLWEENPAGQVFTQLDTLEVKFCGLNNLELSAISFQNLTSLEVTCCWRLQYLTTYSVAKSLARLERLTVDECKMMKEIVACDIDADDASCDFEILFSKLYHLELSDLTSLERFCWRDCSVRVPVVQTLKVNWCPFELRVSSDGLLEEEQLHSHKEETVDAAESACSSEEPRAIESVSVESKEEIEAELPHEPTMKYQKSDYTEVTDFNQKQIIDTRTLVDLQEADLDMNETLAEQGNLSVNEGKRLLSRIAKDIRRLQELQATVSEWIAKEDS